MNKTNKKSKPVYDQDVLNALHKKYGYSKSYIKKFLTGERKATLGDRVIKEYYELVKESEKAQKAKEEKLKQILKD